MNDVTLITIIGAVLMGLFFSTGIAIGFYLGKRSKRV